MKTIVIKYEHKKPEDMETPYRLINESLIFDETISPHKVGKRQINTQPIHVPTKNQLSKATKKKGHTNKIYYNSNQYFQPPSKPVGKVSVKVSTDAY